MGNKEEGNKHTKIPNKLMDVLMSEALNASETKIMLYVARKTHGYHKTWDQISLSQFENKLGLSRPTISKTLKRLVKVGLLVKVQKGTLNANRWKISLSDLKRKLVKLTKLVKYDTKKLVKHTLHTKENTTKESISNTNRQDAKRADKGGKKKEFGDKQINAILSGFKDTLGFSPIDKYPRRVAHNFCQTINATWRERSGKDGKAPEDKFNKMVDYLFHKYSTEDFAEHTRKLRTVYDHSKIVLEKIREEEKNG